MQNNLSNSGNLSKSNIYDNYKNIIIPKIKLLDIFLKSDCIEFNSIGSIINNNNNIKKSKTALNQLLYLFDLDKSDLDKILLLLNKNYIDKELIFYLISHTDCFIANIIRRELQCGSPKLYSPNDISYIYDLDYKKVLEAFDFLNYKFITSQEIEFILFQLN